MLKKMTKKTKVFISGGIISLVAFLLFVMMVISCVFMAATAVYHVKHAKVDIGFDDLPPILTREIVIAAIKSYEKYGVPTAVTLAQVIQESSGTYPKPNGHFSGLAWHDKNLFGVKGEGSAGSAYYSTREQKPDGSVYTIKARFAKYHSFEESIDAHGRLLASSLYKPRVKNLNSSDSWADALQGRYATSLSYASNLKATMKRYNLYRFDGVRLKDLGALKLGGNFGGAGDAKYNGYQMSGGSSGQKKIAAMAQAPEFRNPYSGRYRHMCEYWVYSVYRRAGFSYRGACCAAKDRDTNAYKKGKIPIGAAIYSGSKYHSSVRCGCGRNAGHVAIYIGGGKVAGSQMPYIMTVESWISVFGYGGYSFGGSRSL